MYSVGTGYTVRGCTNEESRKAKQREKTTRCIEKASQKNGHTVKTLSATAYIPHFLFFMLAHMHMSVIRHDVIYVHVQRARILISKHAKGLCQLNDQMCGNFNLMTYSFSHFMNVTADRPPDNKSFALLICIFS